MKNHLGLVILSAILTPSIAEADVLDCPGHHLPNEDNVYIGRLYLYNMLYGYQSTDYVACCVVHESVYHLYYGDKDDITTITSSLEDYDDNVHTVLPSPYMCGSTGGSAQIREMPNTSPWNTIELEIEGDEGVDVIFGLWAGDHLYGGDGDDIIYGGPGDDFIYGDAGFDIILGQAGNDHLYGSDVDCETDDNSPDWIFSGSGDDIVKGCGGDCDLVYGGNANEPGYDICYGGEGYKDYCDQCDECYEEEPYSSTCSYDDLY